MLAFGRIVTGMSTLREDIIDRLREFGEPDPEAAVDATSLATAAIYCDYREALKRIHERGEKKA